MAHPFQSSPNHTVSLAKVWARLQKQARKILTRELPDLPLPSCDLLANTGSHWVSSFELSPPARVNRGGRPHCRYLLPRKRRGPQTLRLTTHIIPTSSILYHLTQARKLRVKFQNMRTKWTTKSPTIILFLRGAHKEYVVSVLVCRLELRTAEG